MLQGNIQTCLGIVDPHRAGRTGHPKKSSGHLLKDTESRFRFIKDHRKEFSVERMAKLLDVSTSGYYGWFSRPESGREQERLLLDVLVKAAYEASRGRYGSLKISRALAEQGRQYRRNRVADSMRRQGLRSKVRRKFVVTTDTKHDLKACPNPPSLKGRGMSHLKLRKNRKAPNISGAFWFFIAVLFHPSMGCGRIIG